MGRRATGQVVERRTKRGVVYALRFYAAGGRRYETLGTAEEGWNRRRAEDELASVMASVRAGTWQPGQVEQAQASVREIPTFHEFSSEWFEANRHGWAGRTVKDYRWALSDHLLPFFAADRLDVITVEHVDRYRAAKLREGRLAPAQINKTLKRLSQILELAEEYGHIARNPARGKRRRVKAPKVRRSWVEPEQALVLIECASPRTRPFVATLTGAGLRVSELVALDWPDVSLATGTVRVGRAKTDAGSYREVDLPGGVVDELAEWKIRSAPEVTKWMAANPGGGEPVFVSKHRGLRRQSAANVARRLKTAIRAANCRLVELGIEPISERVTPQSLRRTYASIRAAAGDDPVYIAEMLGHTDPRFTLSVYTKAVKRRPKLSGAYLTEFDRALDWAALPTAIDPSFRAQVAERSATGFSGTTVLGSRSSPR
jgi:integrase